MRTSGATFQDSSIDNLKVNFTKMALKKEVHLDKVHLLQESEPFNIIILIFILLYF